jgi:hypothetical protein
MKKQLILSILGTVVILFCVSSCDMGSSNNDLIGYWRSERTYQITTSSGTRNMYDIYIFRQNKVMNFTTTSLAYIKYENYDDPFFADWWDSYIIDGGKIKITSADIGDGYQYTITMPFQFLSDGSLVLTLTEYDAQYLGSTSRDVKYIRLE